MFGLSIGEVLLLAVIALIVIGPKQLPEFARQIGRLINEIKRSTNHFAEEMKQQTKIEFDINRQEIAKPEPPPPPPAATTLPVDPEKKDTPT
jgi:sec-independent protein translocase protein TatB